MITDDPRVQQLLDELLESQAAPEQVCAACPELLPVVRARWRQMRLLGADLNILFPSQGGRSQGGQLPGQPDLPQVPGYEVQAVLGRGGMGIVFLARHLRLNRTVALKMILAGPYAVREELERFVHEAEAVAALRHPNIVQVYDAGELDGRPWFTMEFVEGGRLSQKINGVPQPARSSAALVATLAQAIHVAHQNGIVHRDLTPANILLANDGTPKVTDFGLARRLEQGPDDCGMTMTGRPIGTPSYMAPEQARGDKGAIGPATDVYALGAILYDLLTGRPPFRADTVAATLQQVVADEVVRPARLNSRVPRDLETICLKCLQKEPHRRYVSAAALADDLRRFGNGEPIAARPVGLLERGMRWARRRPGLATALAACLLLVASLGGGGMSWYQQRATAVRDAATDAEQELRAAGRLRQQLDFAGAATALRRAKLRLGNTGAAALHDRLTQESQNLELATRLDALRLAWIYSGLPIEAIFLPPEVGIDPAPQTQLASGAKADPRTMIAQLYERAFREAGLGAYDDDPRAVAARIVASPVRDALIAALDNWAASDVDESRRQWVFAVARLADPDPWRDRVRDPKTWENEAAMKELAAQADMDRQPVHLLVLVGGHLWLADEDRGFLTRVVLAHPGDFWANMALGRALIANDPLEAIGCYRTAQAVRPEIAQINGELGDLYVRLHRPVEAIHYLESALHLNSADEDVHLDLGIALQEAKQPEEAIAQFRECTRLKPTSAMAHRCLGDALKAEGRIGEAIDEYRAGFRGDGDGWIEARDGLRDLLFEQGRSAEFRLLWKEVLRTKWDLHEACDGYAELCLFLGDELAYRRARSGLLAQYGDTVVPLFAGQTGLTCLLQPAPEHELQQAVALIDGALSADRAQYAEIKDAYPWLHFARGLADYRQGRYERAAAAMESDDLKALGPTPLLVAAMARHRLGQKDIARRTLADAVASYDWRPAMAKDRNAWIAHILRREAEAQILPNPTTSPATNP